MPIYEYKCKNCGCVKELFFKTFNCTINEKDLTCEKCNNKMEKITSQSTVFFKGDGWTNPVASNYNPTEVKGVNYVKKPKESDKILYKNKKKRK